MSTTPTVFPGASHNSPPVGVFVQGPLDARREVVRWIDQYRDYHELVDHIDPDAPAYLTLFSYPPADYCPHFVRAGHSPREYAGPASCRFLFFDIDRANNLNAALAETRALVRSLLARWPTIEDAIGVYFSGSKGFHTTVELLPGFASLPTVPATARRLALKLAAQAGARIDTSTYDHQRIVRLPNSQHPRTKLHKRFLTLDELFRLDIRRIQELARYPAGYAVPTCGEHIQELEDEWLAAAQEAPTIAQSAATSSHPVVPKFVLDFIGFGDIQDPGRAVTLFRCAAVLAEAGTPDAVIFGLLEEVALKTGLEPAEVGRQIATGIAHGKRKGGAT